MGPAVVKSERPNSLPESTIPNDLVFNLVAQSHNLTIFCVDRKKFELASDLSFCCLMLIIHSQSINYQLAKIEASLCVGILLELSARLSHSLRETHAKGIRAISLCMLKILDPADLGVAMFSLMDVQGHMLELAAAKEIRQKKKKRRRIENSYFDDEIDLNSHIDVFFSSSTRAPKIYRQLAALSMWLKLENSASLILERLFSVHRVTGYEFRFYQILVDDTRCYQHGIKLIENGGAWLRALNVEASIERTWIAQDVWNRGAVIWRDHNCDESIRMFDLAVLIVEKIVEINESQKMNRDVDEDCGHIDRDKLKSLQILFTKIKQINEEKQRNKRKRQTKEIDHDESENENVDEEFDE